jgi:hypothetical protein
MSKAYQHFSTLRPAASASQHAQAYAFACQLSHAQALADMLKGGAAAVLTSRLAKPGGVLTS